MDFENGASSFCEMERDEGNNESDGSSLVAIEMFDKNW